MQIACRLTLIFSTQLWDVQISGENGNRLERELQERPLRFAFQDGKVEALCPYDQDSSLVLNIKRAVISLFQNSMQELDKEHTVSEVNHSTENTKLHQGTSTNPNTEWIVDEGREMQLSNQKVMKYVYSQEVRT